MYHKSSLGESFFKEVELSKAKIERIKSGDYRELEGDSDSVVFEFNSKYVLVELDTDSDWLWSQYKLASLLDIKSVGFFDLESNIVDFDRKIQEAEEDLAKLHAEQTEKHSGKVANAKTIGNKAIELYPPLDLIYKSELQAYLNWKDSNSDGYGRAVFDIAECIMSVANLLSAEKQCSIKSVLEEAEYIADYYVGGASGYQMSAAVHILKMCWIYRECVI